MTFEKIADPLSGQRPEKPSNEIIRGLYETRIGDNHESESRSVLSD